MKKFSHSLRTKGSLYLSVLYLVFLCLSIFSIYFVFIRNQHFFMGDDLDFHLSRIEGLAQSIQQGELFPRLNYFITGGMGYATGIFYPDTFLYPAAIFRLIGFSRGASYVLFLVLMNWATLISSYHSFYIIRKNRTGSLVFAIVYGLSAYHLSDIVYRGAVGESLAFIFIPIIFAGFYEVIKKNEQKWPLLAVGMSCLLLAHLLSAVIMSLFLLIFLVMNLRSILKEKYRIISLLKVIGLTLLLVSNTIFPMLEQLNFQRLKVQEEPAFYLQRMAESIISYFGKALNNLGFNNIGLVILALFVICLVFFRKLDLMDKQLVMIGFFFFIVATDLFPHWLFHQTFLNSVQFPWRYFLLVTFCGSWVFSDLIVQLSRNTPKLSNALVAVILLGTLIVNVHGQFQLRGFERRQVTYSDLDQLDGKSNLGYGAEFLPSGMAGWVSPTGLLSEPQDVLQVSEMKREKNVFSLNFQTTEPTRLIFPLLYYKGYKVEGTGEISDVHDAGLYEGTDMHGFVEVTVNGSGRLTVWYEGTMLQKISFCLSVSTWLVIFGYWLYKRMKARKSKLDFDQNVIA